MSSRVWDSILLSLHPTSLGARPTVLIMYVKTRRRNHPSTVNHKSHKQKGTNHLGRDETYHPMTRKDFNLPDPAHATKMDYKEILEETPAFTLFKMVIRQFLGFQLYLMYVSLTRSRAPPF